MNKRTNFRIYSVAILVELSFLITSGNSGGVESSLISRSSNLPSGKKNFRT